ncbi:hypothetical protein RchiOBHm_Chr6g0309871 [Rosa chinensis]|uniref:Uncharacterized protein n=1 Tax=Rosa chinensis TaxID=74649 RepID=A0A2P6Q114_ROSCH|nr:uncharacterized protein LOC112171818 [Rosa chinensis]PRQ27865.1 hypothetical protein RchiOBHm_Chr6g0309871 [Rosa chinensis]
MRSTKAQNQNRFLRIITVPIRALGKAKDFYVKSMTDVGDRFSYGGSTMAGPGGQFSSGLPKSFSTRSSSSRSNQGNDDFSELVRAASARSYGTRIDVDKILQDQLKRSATTTMGSRQVLPKCGSVAMGRIDEDAACDFEEEGDVKKDLYPRSRSYAVGKRSVAFV